MMMVPARWQRPGRQGVTPRLIVVHCTVSPEMGGGAEAVARHFARTDRPASAHVVVDNDSTVRCVNDEDTAYGAAGANRDGLHLELVGMPDQSAEEWLDAFGVAMLHRAGPIVREWSDRWDIPLRWLTVAEVADGQTRGLCTHHDVSLAFPDVSTGHWDPGPHFPKAEVLRIWAPTGVQLPAPVTPPPSEEDDDMFPRFFRVADGPAQGRIFVLADGHEVEVSSWDLAEWTSRLGPPMPLSQDGYLKMQAGLAA